MRLWYKLLIKLMQEFWSPRLVVDVTCGVSWSWSPRLVLDIRHLFCVTVKCWVFREMVGLIGDNFKCLVSCVMIKSREDTSSLFRDILIMPCVFVCLFDWSLHADICWGPNRARLEQITQDRLSKTYISTLACYWEGKGNRKELEIKRIKTSPLTTNSW